MKSFRVCILETGGTIARVDKLLQGLKISQVQVEIVSIMSKASSNMRPDDWVLVGKSVVESCKAGFDGIVITHGTSTLAYTAAALSFMVQNIPIPVVLTGSVIPGDFPNSDARNNLRNSIAVATSKLAEVCVVFSGSEIGDDGLIIRGTRIRKVHSTKLNAFASINAPPLGVVKESRVRLNQKIQFRKRSDSKPHFGALFNPAVSLIKVYPSLSVAHVEGALKKSAGAVIEAYGSGQILADPKILGALSKFSGPIALCTQCHYGRVDLHPKIGVADRVMRIPNIIPVRDMLAEVALVKLMWILGNGWKPRTSLNKSYCGEINSKL